MRIAGPILNDAPDCVPRIHPVAGQAHPQLGRAQLLAAFPGIPEPGSALPPFGRLSRAVQDKMYDPLWLLREIFSGIQPWELINTTRDSFRVLLDRAFYTFEERFSELKVGVQCFVPCHQPTHRPRAAIRPTRPRPPRLRHSLS